MIKLIDILENKILVPRNIEGRKENKKRADLKKIQQFIKDGSKGDLELRNSPLTTLPNTLAKVGGNLNLSGSKITSLSDNLKVGGYLLSISSQLTSLPDNLKVRGNLWLNKTLITSVPNNLQIGGGISLKDTPLSKKYSKKEIIQMVKDKGGYITKKFSP